MQIVQGPMDLMLNGIRRDHMEVMKKLFLTAYCVLKEEMPFTSFPSLLRLQKRNGSDLKRLDSYCNDQACRR